MIYTLCAQVTCTHVSVPVCHRTHPLRVVLPQLLLRGERDEAVGTLGLLAHVVLAAQVVLWELIMAARRLVLLVGEHLARQQAGAWAHAGDNRPVVSNWSRRHPRWQ